MNNREVIEWLRKKAETVQMPGARKMYEAAAKAISCTHENDLISRQAAIMDAESWVAVDEYEKHLQKNVIEWLKEFPPAELGTNLAEVGTDCISRQAAIDVIDAVFPVDPMKSEYAQGIACGAALAKTYVEQLPSAQPEIIRCKDCIYYDPPHVENNGVRYEYDEMPADAFDALGTGLVNAEYGINIGGRCCVDYYCKNYSDDKRVFVREDNYCGRAERRTDGSDRQTGGD